MKRLDAQACQKLAIQPWIGLAFKPPLAGTC